MGEAYGLRPSAILGVADEWAAFQFDTAVLSTALDERRRQQQKKDDAAGASGDGGKKPARADWRSIMK
jgi:hypothetical protein